MGFGRAKNFIFGKVQHINFSFFMDCTFGVKSKNSLSSSKFEVFFLMFVVFFLSYIVLCFTFKSAIPFVLTFVKLKVLGLAQSSCFGYGYSIGSAHIELFNTLIRVFIY